MLLLGAWARQPLVYSNTEQATVANVGTTFRFEYVGTHYIDTIIYYIHVGSPGKREMMWTCRHEYIHMYKYVTEKERIVTD